MSTVTTHVLDTARGRPASGVEVRLERVRAGAAEPLAQGTTDGDGRISDLGPGDLPAARYRLVFGTGEYFAADGRDTFYPRVVVEFEITDPAQHYHVPLLVSPHGYTTYRGS